MMPLSETSRGKPAMALNRSDNADYWRNRAEEARAVAVQMLDPHTKAVIAQDYEKLAVRAEQRASTSSPTG